MGFDPGFHLRGSRCPSLYLGCGPGALFNFLLFVVGPLVALYFIVKSAVRAGGGAASKAAVTPGLQTARGILDARYACGEIGPEDYERTHLETP